MKGLKEHFEKILVILFLLLILFVASCVTERKKSGKILRTAFLFVGDWSQSKGIVSNQNDICLSNKIIVPNYTGFASVIDCSEINYKDVVTKIYRGFDCESQYVNNLQHKYINTWDTGVSTHELSMNDQSSHNSFCSYTIFFSDLQSDHLYGLLINNEDIIDSTGYVIDYFDGIEFMFKIKDDKIGWTRHVYINTIDPPPND